MKAHHGEGHAQRRRREYPPLEDFVDAYYWLERGDTKKMELYLAKCDAVKRRYPKNIRKRG